MTDIRTYLAQGEPLVFDGAMGTCYAAQPGRAGLRCELANLDAPQEISAIHRAYLEAGCRAIKTNTFALSAMLAQGEDTAALAHAACQLAQAAAEPYGAFVFGDIGPAPQDSGAGAVYCQLAGQLLEAGVTCFLAETLPSGEGIPQLARYLKERCPESFLIVSFAVAYDGFTSQGCRGEALLQAAAETPGVDAAGFNCVSGPHHLLEYIKTLRLDKLCLSVMPNAGYPTVTGRRTVFQGKPAYFGEKLAQIVQAGASIVGGCCGTTPEHIAALTDQLKRPLPRPAVPPVQSAPAAAPQVNPLWDKLEAGRRVVAVELDPPVNDDSAFFLQGVQALKDAGADAVTIADCPIGRPRADSSLLACKIHRELGVDPLPHLTCRDRNRNATRALLLGLSMEGVHNVLLVTGDPIPAQDRSEVKSVYNFNSRKLARYVSGLDGETLRTPFRIFGALNLNAPNFSKQLELAREKEDCGMSGFLTQPVHSLQALEHLKQARRALRGKILGGIFPIVSHRNACFLNNEVSGMYVCDEIVALYQGKERAEAEALAVRISLQIARAIAPYTDGFYLMTPFRRVELVSAILRQIRAGGL